MPRIIPVIDVMNGVIVHGIGGRRDEYKPIRSAIVDSAVPLKVAEAMLAKTGSDEIYIADLDAIRGNGTPSEAVRRLIPQLSAKVWLDHGIRTGAEVPESLMSFGRLAY
jgi:phosphoribosylformimino-5-aminoimidazole carboxamide ribotide isomerase